MSAGREAVTGKRSQSGPPDLSLHSRDGRLRVLFDWQHDRYRQRIWLDEVEAGESVDGDAAAAWPPSPPIQQLSLETIGDAPVLLGVGGAGRGHWSISVEATAEAGLKFDVACRCSGEPGTLGSTYRLAAALQLVPLDAVVDSESGDEQQVFVGPLGDLERASPAGQPRATVRWSYELKPRR